MSDFYHDDPVEALSTVRKKPKALFGSVLLLFAGGLFLNTTLAANINLNSGGQIEFGQGVSVTAACAGSSTLTVTPNTSFVNAAGAGGLCNFLEVAPANWSGGQDPARAFVPPSFTTEIPNHPKPPKTNSTSELGLGYKYSDIVAAVSADKTYAAGRARTYSGGGRSDWYLPVTTELNQLCKYVAGQAWVSDITICTGSSNPSLGMSTVDGYWTSSGTSEYAKAAMMQRMLNGIQEEKFYVHIGAKIRPIRAF